MTKKSDPGVVLKQKRSRQKKPTSAATKFSVVEAYKTLRTNLQFMMKNDRCNVISVTSTLPRDGKSTVVANLGVAFSQTENRVLIVDCDMRKPRINKFFDVAASPGLSNYLVKLTSLEKVIQKTSYPNLHVISSGTLPPNPAELLSGTEMLSFVEEIRDRFDLVILDAPPLSMVSDAYIMTKYSDGVLLVIKHAFTTYAMVDRCVKGLNLVNTKIWGIVMNDVDMKKIYGKRDGYYYKYGYNYDNGVYAHPSVYSAGLLSQENGEQSPEQAVLDFDVNGEATAKPPAFHNTDNRDDAVFSVSRIDPKKRSGQHKSSFFERITKGK
jgi:capsular exopolysaccharide synthesis family protein